MWRVTAILLAAGCSGGLDWEGTPGQAVPARFDSWVPSLSARVDGGDPVDLLVDTGAPYTLLDREAFPALPEGEGEVDLDAFALHFPGLSVLVADVLPGAGDLWQGLIGGELLDHFAFTIDYRGEQLWLDEQWRGPPPGAPATGAAVDADVDLRGTRVLVPARIEDQATPVWMLVDSGATAVTLDVGVAEALAGGRPRLDGVTVTTASGSTGAYFIRVWQLAIGAAAEPSVAALVVDDASLFAGLSQEVGRPVAGLVGGSFLRAYLTGIDYPDHALHLHRYAAQDHIDPDEFVRVGFTLAPAGATWEVRDVYPGTDAAAEGLTPGAPVAAIDGTTLAGLDGAAVGALIDGHALGDELAVDVDLGAGVEEHLVTVEDLLPRYDMP
ncbi:MAG TPA: aspartyl protease family protein [Kofleriaceae bacterium]|nr:aspartyl protease family protein [Kofleriaceae bacterium]